MNKINFYISKERVWQILSFASIFIYLLPLVLFNENINLLVYDNLDSNVVWLKILAQSNMIFAPNDAIVPNMMGGLPRISYGKELNILLWLYYLFPPITAYILNIIFIHTAAFFSMYLLSKHYLVNNSSIYKNTLIYFSSIVFALQPFWPSAGLSIAVLPLVTYIFANIYNNKSTAWQWLLLILIPLYTSFILVYIFYLTFAILYFLFKIFQDKKVHKNIIFALLIMGTTYLLIEYRLVGSILFENNFLSHRSEFNIYFTKELQDVLTMLYKFFLNGHETHLKSIQMPIILPLILFGMLSQLLKKKLTEKESLIIFTLFIFSILLNIWQLFLYNIYTIPILILFILITTIKQKHLSLLNTYILLLIFLSTVYSFTFYIGFNFISDELSFFKSFSLARASFILPLILAIVLVSSLNIIVKKYHYGSIFIIFLLPFQLYNSFTHSFHSTEPIKEYSSFNNYYAPNLFNRIKKSIPQNIQTVKVVSYGIEPAVSLYNGFYTVDGYSVNYPLEYKKKFRKVNKKDIQLFENWGSKLYITSIRSTPMDYKKGLEISSLRFDIQALCQLKTDYMISSYKLLENKKKNLVFVDSFKGKENSWDIYLYKLNCY